MEPSVRTTIVCVIPIYIAQAAIGGLTFVGLPAYLRQTGVALEHIGLIFLFMLPWALKFLWAGFVERLRYHRLKGDKSIKLITIGQVMMTLEWPPYRPDTGPNEEGLRISSSICLCPTTMTK